MDTEESATSVIPPATVVSTTELHGDVRRQLGAGAFGVVWCVRSDVSGRELAVKKLSDLETTSSARRVYNELCALTHLRHENILSVQGIVLLPAIDDFTEVHVLSEVMATDLRRVLVSGQRLSPSHVQLFLYQILNALKYIHSLKVIHGDVKPENILVNVDCRLKLGDFGLVSKQRRPTSDVDESGSGQTEPSATSGAGHSVDGGSGDVVVGGGGTLSYAAPELLLGVRPTTCAVDVWAAGCLLAEMITGRVIFHASTVIQQLDLMVDLLGVFACGEEDFNGAVGPARRYLRRKLSSSVGRAALGSKPLLWSLMPADHNVQHLLTRMLILSPRQRLSARHAMEHVEAGRRLYHTTLCHCCQHGCSPADSSLSATASDAGLATSPGRLHVQLGDRRSLTESEPLPQQQEDIPLDVGDDARLDAASIDALKDKIRKLCLQMDLNGSSRYHRNSMKTIIQHCN